MAGLAVGHRCSVEQLEEELEDVGRRNLVEQLEEVLGGGGKRNLVEWLDEVVDMDSRVHLGWEEVNGRLWYQSLDSESSLGYLELAVELEQVVAGRDMRVLLEGVHGLDLGLRPVYLHG